MTILGSRSKVALMRLIVWVASLTGDTRVRSARVVSISLGWLWFVLRGVFIAKEHELFNFIEFDAICFKGSSFGFLSLHYLEVN